MKTKSMIYICKEEGVSLEQVFFFLVFFAIGFIIMGYLNIAREGQLAFRGDQEKNNELFDVGILGCNTEKL